MFDSLFFWILTVLVICVGIQCLKAVVFVAAAKPRLALLLLRRVKAWLLGEETSDGPNRGSGQSKPKGGSQCYHQS